MEYLHAGDQKVWINWLADYRGGPRYGNNGRHSWLCLPPSILMLCSPVDQKSFLGPGHCSEPEQLSLVQIQLYQTERDAREGAKPN